jgi:hypothetical protein
VGKDARQGFNSLVVFGAWTIWRVRNDMVFNGVSPRVSLAITLKKTRPAGKDRVTPDFEVINQAINYMCAKIKVTHI